MSRRHDQEHGSKTARMEKQGYVHVHFWLTPEQARVIYEALELVGGGLNRFILAAAWKEAKQVSFDLDLESELFDEKDEIYWGDWNHRL